MNDKVAVVVGGGSGMGAASRPRSRFSRQTARPTAPARAFGSMAA